MSRRVKRYALSDTAQQIAGGFLLAGPFVVTEEVWVLAGEMTLLHAAATTGLVFLIGYVTLYKADERRDPDREADVGGVPARFVSLMLVSFGSVTILALAFGAPGTFLEGHPSPETIATTVKAISAGAVFSVIGAATADSLL